MVRQSFALLMIALFTLNGCTALRTAGTDWDARRDTLLSEDSWSLTGRIAAKTATGEGGQATLNWRQQGEVSALQLAGPFGAGRVELEVTPAAVTLRTAEGETVSYAGADAAERFMQEQFGWSFPVRSARFWMRGLLDPLAAGERVFDEAGELTGLRQHGWEISLTRFATVNDRLLPTRMTLENPQLRLRAAVSTWAL